MEQVCSRNPRRTREAIAIDENATLTTHDEAVLLKNDIDAHPDTVKTVALATDPWHARRARWIYKRCWATISRYTCCRYHVHARTFRNIGGQKPVHANEAGMSMSSLVIICSATRFLPEISAHGRRSLTNSSKNHKFFSHLLI